MIVYHKGTVRFIAGPIAPNYRLRVDIFSFKSQSPLVSALKSALEDVRIRTKPSFYDFEGVENAIQESRRCASTEKSAVAVFEITALLSESYMHAALCTRGVLAFVRRKILFCSSEEYRVNEGQENAKRYVNEIGGVLYNTLGIHRIRIISSYNDTRVFYALCAGVLTLSAAWSSILTAIDGVKAFGENGIFVAAGEMTGAAVLGIIALSAGWLAKFVAFGITRKIRPAEQEGRDEVQIKSAETTSAV